MIWRWRRKRQRTADGQDQVPQDSGAPASQSGSARQAGQRPQPQVTWPGVANSGGYDARTDVFSISDMPAASQHGGSQHGGSQHGNGGLGRQMPGIYCPKCGAANQANARFCSQCATPLTRDRATAGETTSLIFAGAEPTEAEPTDQAVADAATVDTLPPNTALLVVRRGPNEGSRFLLDSQVTEVGRRPDSDIFLDDVTVSRRHAEFYRSGGKFAVRDVGSLNGTYVNRNRIEEAALNGGDEVQIGKFRMVFLQGRLSHAESGV